MNSSSHQHADHRAPAGIASTTLMQVRKRSFVLDGRETSIGLEEAYWRVIEEVAKTTDKTWRDVVSLLIRNQPGHADSHARWVRVWCVGILHRRLREVLSTNKGQ